jgi:hypothetical protein
MRERKNVHQETSARSYDLSLNDRVCFRLHDTVEAGPGDSSALQKGLVMLVEGRAVCGEGVGFGVPAVEYPGRILFCTHATVQAMNRELVKSFLMDTVQRKTWRQRVPVDNRVYLLLEQRLVNRYRLDSRQRAFLFHVMRLISLLGFRLSYRQIGSRGLIEIRYRLSGSNVEVTVDSSQLLDRRYKRLLIFNEQSSGFDLYKDQIRTLEGDEIGVWEMTESERACLTNSHARVTFCVRNVKGAGLYRGRELLRPRLDWAGFCYSVPPSKGQFEYTIEIN